MKKLLSIVGLMAGMYQSAQSQQLPFTEIQFDGNGKCAFNDVLQKAHYPYAAAMKEYENVVSQARLHPAALKTTGTLYRIPVVFHVVYNAGMPTFNLPDSVLVNQINVLNKAFRKTHADTGNTRTVFKPLSKDAEIEFFLATKDPQGNPTNGITRTVSPRFYFGTSTGDLDSLERIKSSMNGGKDPWPVTKYLNIWIGNLTNSQGQLSVLGYAIPPLNPVPPNWPAGTGAGLAGFIDGVVIQPHAIGDNNVLSAQLQGTYTKGRCAVHEVAHYLGLMHTFGATDGGSTSNCGTALITDGIADTPEQSLLSQVAGGVCASSTKNSCGASSPNDLPDMWENYMDYTTDACQTMFTNDQVTIMRSVMANQRNSLNTPVTSVAAVDKTNIAIYPNPASAAVSIYCEDEIAKVTITNYLGQPVKLFDGKAAREKTYDVGALAPGLYILTASTANGKTIAGKFSIVK